jgi:hypothetical protein
MLAENILRLKMRTWPMGHMGVGAKNAIPKVLTYEMSNQII